MSETRAACCMLCVTITIVTSRASSTMVSSITRVDVGSSAEHGSSMSSTRGFTASDRAMQSRCCWPPDRLPPGASSRSLTSFQRPPLTRHDSTSTSLAPREARVPVSLSPDSTFSRIDIAGNGFGFWNTIPIARRASISRRDGS